MEVFISSDKNQNEFIDAALQTIEDKREAASQLNIDIRPVYPPRNIGRKPANIVERINQIKDAAIVLMNVTPIGTITKDERDIFVVNSGVCIEFGILIGINRIEKCHMFCSNQFQVGSISPIFHGQNIDSFDPAQTDSLKKIIGEYIDAYLRKSTDLFEKYVSSTSGTTIMR